MPAVKFALKTALDSILHVSKGPEELLLKNFALLRWYSMCLGSDTKCPFHPKFPYGFTAKRAEACKLLFRKGFSHSNPANWLP